MKIPFQLTSMRGSKILIEIFPIKTFSIIFSYQLADTDMYEIPMMPDRKTSIDYIMSLPLIPNPEVFGLHANADITKNFNETQSVSDKLLIIFCLVPNHFISLHVIEAFTRSLHDTNTIDIFISQS